MPDTLQDLVEGVVAQLADVLATTANQAVRPLPAVGGGAVDWQVPLEVAGPVEASVTLGMSAGAAQRLTGLLLNSEGEQSDIDIVDTLREIVTQATAALVAQEASALTIAVGAPRRETITPPAAAWQHDLVMEGDEPPRVAFWTTGPVVIASAPDPAGSRAAATTGMTAMGAGYEPGQGRRNLDVVMDLELPITVRFGETRLTLDALARLGPGSLIDLERSPEDPVELLVNGRLVARGEVVVVGGCYGVRVRDVVSAADRLRTLEG